MSKKVNFSAKKLGVTLATLVLVLVTVQTNAASWGGYTLSGFKYTTGSGTTSTSTTTIKDDPTCESVAKVLKATASSFASYDTQPVKAIDGYTSTTWKSAYKPAWIELQLDGEYDVTGLRVNVNQTPDASASTKPTPAYHEIYAGDTSAHTLAMVYNKDLYNAKWKRMDFGNSAKGVSFIRINTKSTPASQVAWNEIEVCGAVPSQGNPSDSYLKAQDGSGYAVVNFCQGRYHNLSAYASVPAEVRVLEGNYTGYLPSALTAGASEKVFVDAKAFVGLSPWTGAALGNGTFVKFGLVSSATGETLATVGVSRNDAGCYGTVNTQDGSNYGIVDKCNAGSKHTLRIYSQVPATLKVSKGSYGENVNFNVEYDKNVEFVVDADKFTAEPSPWDSYNGYTGSQIGNGSAVTFTLYRDDLGTELASATISRNDTCTEEVTYNYPPVVVY